VSAVKDAVAERAAGSQPSRLKSFVAAMTVGVAATVVTYRLLRTRSGRSNGGDGGAADMG
jgi:hypothetical protein